MERWRRWGLSEDEWNECVEAAGELALIPGAPHMSAEEIAAQLAVAKAAEQPGLLPDAPGRTLDIQE